MNLWGVVAAEKKKKIKVFEKKKKNGLDRVNDKGGR